MRKANFMITVNDLLTGCLLLKIHRTVYDTQYTRPTSIIIHSDIAIDFMLPDNELVSYYLLTKHWQMYAANTEFEVRVDIVRADSEQQDLSFLV